MKKWIPVSWMQCELHGEELEILTDAEQTMRNGVCANDGDRCRCSEGCTGWMTSDEDNFYANWDGIHYDLSPNS
jgi:hypothetical protein